MLAPPLTKRQHNPTRPAKRAAPKPHKAEPPRKKGKGKGKGKHRDSWAATHQGKQICRRFQHGLCKSDNCQFAHVCAVKGCQQAHGASQRPTQSGGCPGCSSGQCSRCRQHSARSIHPCRFTHPPASKMAQPLPAALKHDLPAEHAAGSFAGTARTNGEQVSTHPKGGFLLHVFAGIHAPISAIFHIAPPQKGKSRLYQAIQML